MFKPLATAYSTQLSRYLQDSQGLLNLTKGDFFPLFWRSWTSVFRPQLIKRSFEATGIQPANPDAVLKKFAKEASDSESSQSVLSGDDWLKLKSIVRREVKDQSSKDVKKLQRSLCHISAQNSILHEEIRGLRQSLAIKERRPKQSFTLQLNEDEVYHGGAKIWSPRSETRKRKAAEKAEKEHRRSLRDAAKAIQLPQSGKRKASKPHKPATKRQKRGGVAPAVVGAARGAPAVLPRSRRDRVITPSKKNSE
ncbi:hypothetical protein CC77DRAFT_949568 [Alternaria alternata]|uniref:Uncharacterized protein n=1 Tax=Alternaria alternata TaxID=5599 RepID=A0A177D3P8_ALTAL|nr:hypothetical protein CC77DRAFT_949568 [Alternaria alternata]OAG14116.1 hypothetical protein CC77DRAFT_949568 [Alternaria alternata]